MAEAKLTAMIRASARDAFMSFPAVARVDVVMVWVVKDRRKRDVENPVPTLKALCDGLVDAGIVPDDTPNYMVKHMPRIVYDPGARPEVLLKVRELPPESPFDADAAAYNSVAQLGGD
jgi:hypothetical protein